MPLPTRRNEYPRSSTWRTSCANSTRNELKVWPRKITPSISTPMSAAMNGRPRTNPRPSRSAARIGVVDRAPSGFTRTKARNTRSGTNVSALMRKPQPGPNPTTMKPATAGPITGEYAAVQREERERDPVREHHHPEPKRSGRSGELVHEHVANHVLHAVARRAHPAEDPVPAERRDAQSFESNRARRDSASTWFDL